MAKADQYLVRVVAPHFVAGFVFDGSGEGRIVSAAPILHKLRGMSADDARAFIRQQGWDASIVQSANG